MANVSTGRISCGWRDIEGGWHEGPNSAGGVSVSFRYRNNSSKTIKYVVFSVVGVNRVGDPAPCTIKGTTTMRLNAVGPLAPGKSSSGVWENAWYNYSIVAGLLTEIEVEYMDGTTETISGSALAEAGNDESVDTHLVAMGVSAAGAAICYVAYYWNNLQSSFRYGFSFGNMRSTSLWPYANGLVLPLLVLLFVPLIGAGIAMKKKQFGFVMICLAAIGVAEGFAAYNSAAVGNLAFSRGYADSVLPMVLSSVANVFIIVWSCLYLTGVVKSFKFLAPCLAAVASAGFTTWEVFSLTTTLVYGNGDPYAIIWYLIYRYLFVVALAAVAVSCYPMNKKKTA